MKKLLPLLALASSALLSSCNTTLDYGYYVNEFDENAIRTLFALSDESASALDFNTYSGLHGPSYTSVDLVDGSRNYMGRSEYLDMVKDIFNSARELRVTTMIMDIEFTEPGSQALVTTQEEDYRKLGSDIQHYTSLYKVTVGYEDGWIFFERSERSAFREIQK